MTIIDKSKNEWHAKQARTAKGDVVRRAMLIPGRVRRRLQTYYRRWFCNLNYVFRHDGPFPSEERQDCTFHMYQSFQDLPEKVKADIVADGSDTRLSLDRRELEENATLWIAVVEDRVATTVFTRHGKHFRRWFVPLEPDDVVVFRLRTSAEFRGRGLAPSLMRYAIHRSVRQPARAYIDCRTYNMASIRCIEKTGFKQIAKKKTISRDWALYE